MKRLQFNFNNEADIIEIMQDNDGTITIPSVEGAPSFNSIGEFAEFYATVRNVAAENLKNWQLVEDGDVYSFVLRAGTAGVSVLTEGVDEILTRLYDSLAQNPNVHALDITRLKGDITSMGDDIEEALANSRVPAVANIAYNFLSDAGIFAEDFGVEEVEEEVEEEVDEIDDLLKTVETRTGTLALFAQIVGIDVSATKEEVRTAIENHPISFSAQTLFDIYNDMLAAKAENSNAETETELVALITQSAVGVKDDTLVSKLIQSARFASRNGVPIDTIRLGTNNVIKDHKYISIADLETMEVVLVDKSPTVYIMDATVDAEVEALNAETDVDALNAETDVDAEDAE